MRIAVIGAGPAGFYATDQLLAAGFEVDLLDALPTPFGLVRSGVAPDHPKIKAVTRVYEKTAAKPGFRFFGGVVLGEHVARAELLERYHAVVYAVGTDDDNRLGIPGEDRPRLLLRHAIRGLVQRPPGRGRRVFDLSPERAVVIGNGNVAIDVARMLRARPRRARQRPTSPTTRSAPLGEAQVQEVILLGRRGPAQAAFTNPELRELGGMTARRRTSSTRRRSTSRSRRSLDKIARRNVEILRDYAQREPSGSAGHRIDAALPALAGSRSSARARTGLSPASACRDQPARGRPRGADRRGGGDRLRARVALDRLPRRPLGDVPFDADRGLIRNDGGRVCDEAGIPHRGEYASAGSSAARAA